MKFELNDQHIQVIAQALGNAPYNASAPVITELQKQINEQQNAEKLSGLPEQSS